MIKYFLTGVGVLAVAASGAALTNLGHLDDPGVSKAGSVLLNGSASRLDEIWLDQSFDDGAGDPYVTNGLSIYGGASYESADDFIPENDVTVQEVVIWLSGQDIDLRCDFFESSSSGPGDDPPADFYNEEVSSADITWEATGYYYFGYPCIKCTVPISDCELTGGDYYWLGFQNTTGPNTFWWAFDYGDMGGPYWESIYFYYTSYWTQGGFPAFHYELFYELWGTTGPPDEENPTVTDMYPLDDDFPSGVPPAYNTAGCHWRDGDPETNKGIDVDASSFYVYDADTDPVEGTLTVDDYDLWDVLVDFEADDDWEEGAAYAVETETYDLAGNSATELWTFDVGYTNVVERSFGVIKAKFR